MDFDYKRNEKGRFVKGTPQPYGFGKGKQEIPWNYHGGSIDQDTGYKRIYISGNRIYEHQYIWELHNGIIPENCVIHHIDGNKLNNNISNLQCISRSEHNKIHNLGEN